MKRTTPPRQCQCREIMLVLVGSPGCNLIFRKGARVEDITTEPRECPFLHFWKLTYTQVWSSSSVILLYTETMLVNGGGGVMVAGFESHQCQGIFHSFPLV